MPVSYEHRQRQLKTSAMVDALGKARTQTSRPTSWNQVLARIGRYEPADWQALSLAAGRANRVPSEVTRGEVVAAVEALAASETADVVATHR